MPDYEEIVARHQLIVAAEAAQVHAAWFETYRELYHPKTAELIERGQTIQPAALDAARDGPNRLRLDLTRLMELNGLDLWIMPGAPGAAPEGLASTGDPVMNLPWTHSGLPTISLPAGRNAVGLPLGLQLAGRWYADEAVMDWAAQVESVLDN
jgi:Asp-tRNA(Asn)/Glu-tRNA(Gln) amidotransferase A subunit family amidase